MQNECLLIVDNNNSPEQLPLTSHLYMSDFSSSGSWGTEGWQGSDIPQLGVVNMIWNRKKSVKNQIHLSHLQKSNLNEN